MVRISSAILLGCITHTLFSSCVYHDLYRSFPSEPISCGQDSLEIFITDWYDVSHCREANGQIDVATRGGSPPYHYSLNEKESQTGVFTALAAGHYSICVTDQKGCTDTVRIAIENHDSDLQAMVTLIADDECFSDNGRIETHAAGGIPPYRFKLNNASEYTVDSVFTNLRSGRYTVTVQDQASCLYAVTADVPHGATGIRWEQDIRPIIETRCAKSGCHTTGSGRVDFTYFENVKAYASQIKRRTQERSMPYDGSLPDYQIQLIGCWVDDGALQN